MSDQIIREGEVKLSIPEAKKVSAKMPIFYNPEMRLNRDIAVLLLSSVAPNKLQIADVLAGSGVRAARFLVELPKNKIKNVAVNDANQRFRLQIAKLVKQNYLPKRKINVHNTDANFFLLSSAGFDYIDIDPFGSPNNYLDSAIKRLSRRGILAVTATDTSALAGSHENACKRKYWAVPLRNELMHEVGIRILARKVQLVGAQFEKALVPIFCHSTLHYLRVYFQCVKGKRSVDAVLKQHLFLLFCKNCRASFVSRANLGACENCGAKMIFAGPLWAGKVWDSNLTKKMLKLARNDDAKNLLKTILDESMMDNVGFYSISRICKKLKLVMPKKNDLIDNIKKMLYAASSTHFAGDGIRTNIPYQKLKRLLLAKQ